MGIRLVVMVALLASLSACSSRAQERKDAAVYFASVCEKEGYAQDSPEHPGCVAAKLNQAFPRHGSGRMSTTCTTIGGNVHCN